jgi:tetratricopeptide (TPR) repeat protein
VQRALKLANQVNDLTLKASLEQTLAMVYVYRKETVLALGHGQTAYALWQKLHNPVEMGRTAIILSQAYRTGSQFDRSAQYLEIAQEHFAKTNLARQEAVTAYEKGCLYLQQRQPAAAQEWLELALQEFKSVGMDNQIAGAAHGLALAQIELKQFDKARANLKAALATWQDLKYWHEQANAHYALGYLDSKMERRDCARQSWEQASQLCSKIPDIAFRATLEAQIAGALKELDDFRPDL